MYICFGDLQLFCIPDCLNVSTCYCTVISDNHMYTIENSHSPLYWVHYTLLDCHYAGRPFRTIPLLIIAVLFQQHSKVTKQSLVCDWWATSEALMMLNYRFAQNREGSWWCWPSAADEAWYSPKRFSSTVQSNMVVKSVQRWVPFPNSIFHSS